MASETKKTGLELMRAPFPEHQISVLCRSTKKDNPKGKCQKCGGWHGLPAVALNYVGHAALTDRLLSADPAWTWEPLALDANGYPVIDKDGGMWIKLTVCGVTRLGYGDAQGKTGGDAMKERIGDALRNAAMRFGAALDLWHKGDLHADEHEAEAEQQSAPAGMTERQVADFVAAIQAAGTLQELQRLYTESKAAAEAANDRNAYTQFKAEVARRKKEIEASQMAEQA